MTAETTTERKPSRSKVPKSSTPIVTITDVEVQLRRLSPGELISVLDYVTYLAERKQEHDPESLDQILAQNEVEMAANSNQSIAESFGTALLSEEVLAKYWDTPEEDEAWAYMQEETL